MTDALVARLLEHRQFDGGTAEYEGLIEEDDIVMDVVILARLKRPQDMGSGTSALLVIADNDVDDLMVEGMLSRALCIQQAEITSDDAD